MPSLPASRLLLLQHLIASHQGRYEWQSPREPRTLEALVLHYADDLDAKVTQAGALLSAIDGGWTAYDRSLGRDFLHHLGTGTAPASGGKPQPARRTSSPRPGSSAGSNAEPPPGADPPPERRSPVLDTLDLFDGEDV